MKNITSIIYCNLLYFTHPGLRFALLYTPWIETCFTLHTLDWDFLYFTHPGLDFSSITPAGSAHKSGGGNMVCLWVQLKR